MLTVGDLVAFESFRAAGAHIVAGAAAADRPVRRVVIAESLTGEVSVRSDELLLADEVLVPRDPAACRRLLVGLEKSGAAGLLLSPLSQTGRGRSEQFVAAGEDGVPVITLDAAISLIEVTEQVQARLVTQQLQLLTKAESLTRDFQEMILSGDTSKPILTRLSGLVENPVILEDAAHHVVDFGVCRAPIEESLRDWDRHSRSGHRGTAGVGSEEGGSCAWVDVSFRRQRWGRLHIVAVESPIDEFDRIALERAGYAIGLWLMGQQNASYLVEGARLSLINDVASGRVRSPEELFRRARSVGVNLERSQLHVISVRRLDAETFPAADRKVSERMRQDALRGLMEELRVAVGRHGGGVLAGIEGESVVALVSVPAGKKPLTVIERGAADLADAVRAKEPGSSVIVGVSDACDVGVLPRFFEQAREAARHRARVDDGQLVRRYDELGVSKLFMRLADDQELAGYVESELGPLLAHDARRGTGLVATLHSYVSNGGCKTATARELFIERRTLYHRIDRIETILGRSLEERDAFLRLGLALEALSYLRSVRSSTHRD